LTAIQVCTPNRPFIPSVRAPQTCTTGFADHRGIVGIRLWDSSVTDAPANAISPRRLEAATKRLRRRVIMFLDYENAF
jgi:hypothetical protein